MYNYVIYIVFNKCYIVVSYFYYYVKYVGLNDVRDKGVEV